MMDNENMKKVIEALKSRDNFLITSHVNPEGDSIGSQLAVHYILERLGKRSVMVDHDGVPDNLRFLPGTGSIACEVPEDFHPDTAIVLDCAVKERAGDIGVCLDRTRYIINIDHHVSNEFFGDVNWVEPKASSVGEMVYHIIKNLGMAIEKELAQAMYAAIVTDTGMFTYDNTSKQTHEIAGELITKGVRPNALHREIFEKKSVSDVRLLGRVLGTLKVEENGLLAHMGLTRQMYAEEGIDHVSTDEFINFPRSIKGVEVAVFFKQSYNTPEHINVSFRSGGKVNVNIVASRFGGGGHERAAGCTLTGTFADIREKVLAEVARALKEGDDNLES
jgi:phosphoesterase RecJ-like protein